MKRKAKARVAVGVVMLIIVLIAVPTMLKTTSAQATQAGVYQVDPFWPKPLPNRWVFGSVVGLAVDSRDHVWVVHRGKASMDPDLGGMMAYPPDAPRFGGGVRPMAGPISEHCCLEAPPVMEFDPAGNVVGSWGGPGEGYEWPRSMHGITVDGKDNVWLAGNSGNTVLKFTRDGKFLLQVGKNGASKGNTDPVNFHNPAEVSVDDAANEAYIADGYGNRRVVVIDATTGKFKRMWGGLRQATRPILRLANCSKPMILQSRCHSTGAPCTASPCPMTASCMSAIASTPEFRCFAKTGRLSKRCGSPRARSAQV